MGTARLAVKSSLFISEEQTPLVFGWGSIHSTHRQRPGLQRRAAPHRQLGAQPGAVSGTCRGAGGAAVRGVQRAVCGLGWQPGREQRWRLAASLLPELTLLEQGAGTGALLCVSSASDLVGSLGRNSPLNIFFRGIFGFARVTVYFQWPFTKHFLIQRCV